MTKIPLDIAINDSVQYILEKTPSMEALSYLAMQLKGRAFLTSLNHREHFGRYSLVSLNPLCLVKYDKGKLTIEKKRKTLSYHVSFQTALNLVSSPLVSSPASGPFNGAWTGYISYEAGRYLMNTPSPDGKLFELPEMAFYFSDSFLVIDHFTQESFFLFLSTSLSTESPEKRKERYTAELAQAASFHSPARSEYIPKLKRYVSKDVYLEKIRKIKDYIIQGDIYQANYAYPLSLETEEDSASLFTRYVRKNPVDCAALLNYPWVEILSISPECFFILQDSVVKSFPIKGTIHRGASSEEDAELRRTLLASEKDQAELSMIVDLIRNDIGKVAQQGSVKVKRHASIETFHTLYHLYSLVEGTIQRQKRSKLVASMFPGGSITGAPKKRAMEIIAETENYQRGIYCGSVGWLGYNGDMMLSIGIRTIQRYGSVLYYFSGSGIVLDSDPAAEYDETIVKSAAFTNIFKKIEITEPE